MAMFSSSFQHIGVHTYVCYGSLEHSVGHYGKALLGSSALFLGQLSVLINCPFSFVGSAESCRTLKSLLETGSDITRGRVHDGRCASGIARGGGQVKALSFAESWCVRLSMV